MFCSVRTSLVATYPSFKKISKHNPFQILRRPEWVTQDMLCLCVALRVPDSVAKQDDKKKHPVGKISPVVNVFRVLLANLSLLYSLCQLNEYFSIFYDSGPLLTLLLDVLVPPHTYKFSISWPPTLKA